MNKYIRQETLKEIGATGQKKIRNSKIAIIGIGALGTLTAELLTRAGIGELLLIDQDKITIENIHRQFLYKEQDRGKLKTETAKKALNKINKDVNIKTHTEYLNEKNTHILNDYDLILDCTDNMLTRHIINNYCKEKQKTWIHAAATGVKGNVLVVTNPETFKKIIRTGETFDNCEQIGVLNTLTTMISTMQVTQALKIILNKPHENGLIRINAWTSEFKIYKIKQ